MKEQKIANLKSIIDQLVEKKSGEYAEKKINLVSNVFVLNNMVFLDADEADKMLSLIIDYVIGVTNTESTLLLTLKQSASTNADFASYEFSIRSNDVCIEDADRQLHQMTNLSVPRKCLINSEVLLLAR